MRRHAAETEIGFARARRRRVQTQSGARRVMAGQHARGLDRPLGCREIADGRGDILDRNATRPQQARFGFREIDDRGFQADRARAAVEHEIDARAQALRHVARGGGGKLAGRVGARCRDRHARTAQQRARDRMGGDAHADAVEARARGGTGSGPARGQDQGQRARPEQRPEQFGAGIERRDPARGLRALPIVCRCSTPTAS